jgi:3-ketosteroid 9alpha-monooxygenase subunit B
VGTPGPAAELTHARRDHGYHGLSVAEVVHETSDATSYVFDVPDDLRSAFAYEPGQFCTFRLVIDGEPYVRCYSMSSAPPVDDKLAVTVKRVPDGVVSNWWLDNVTAGDTLDVQPPAGFFQLTDGDGDVVMFAAGSGVTPVFSLLKTAMAATGRRAQLLYANRDRESVIFGSALDALAARHPDRLRVVHHLDVDDGFVRTDTVETMLSNLNRPDFYICGPAPFMGVVEGALLANGIEPARIHIERFDPVADVAVPAETAATTTTRVTIELDDRTDVADHRPGTTILQTARQLGMSPPYSCESGSCATCMGRLLEGTVQMRTNNALTPEEVEDGWILTCQSVPTSPRVHVVYGYD